MLETVDQWFIYCLQKYGFDTEFLVLAMQGGLSNNIIKKFISKMPQCLISPYTKDKIDISNIHSHYTNLAKSYVNNVQLLKEGKRCDSFVSVH